MTDHKDTGAPAPDPAEAAQKWAALAERSQKAVEAFMERQSEGGDYSIADPSSIGQAFMEMTAQLMRDPAKFAEAQMQLWQDNLTLWQNTQRRLLGEEVEPLIQPKRGDRRFKDKAWDEELVFDYIKQSYLLSARWVRSLVGEVDGLDPKVKGKVDFYTRQFVSAMAPSNFAMTNPAVLRRTKETGGENLLSGLEHMLDDLEAGKGRLQISMTDTKAFKVGENVAASPGKVVFQNDLMQLIQYAPSTKQVHTRPLLVIPPWINKFYVLDLQPKNSFVKWIVDQGYTLFIISWVNPRKELSHKSFEDYMMEGPMAALDAMEQATGVSEANILGFCIGGILTIGMLSYLAAKGDQRIKAATFLATLVDFKDVGEISVFVDPDQLDTLEKHMDEKGYLEGHHMADMFNMMRENDLIWSFVVNNYLLGRDPFPFDLLYWNSDSTRLPATMLAFYLRKFYVENGLMTPGTIVYDGVPIDLGRIKTPTYFLATKDDHIAPWRSTYPGTKALAGPVRFVLGASGHIAGIVNPPAAQKYGYWTNAKTPADPDDWFAGATAHEGSWWPDWHKWLARRSGPKVPARKPGDGKLKALEDAPGSYVKVRASE
jgi:polyhydroxyalkanoate synthase